MYRTIVGCRRLAQRIHMHVRCAKRKKKSRPNPRIHTATCYSHHIQLAGPLWTPSKHIHHTLVLATYIWRNVVTYIHYEHRQWWAVDSNDHIQPIRNWMLSRAHRMHAYCVFLLVVVVVVVRSYLVGNSVCKYTVERSCRIVFVFRRDTQAHMRERVRESLTHTHAHRTGSVAHAHLQKSSGWQIFAIKELF